jgi:hypothetical protein
VGPRTSLDDVESRKILPLSGLELNASAVQPVASRYTDCSIQAPFVNSYKKHNYTVWVERRACSTNGGEEECI